MKLLKKLLSKKGQLSMEVGVLVAAAVLVAIVAGYYYVKNASSAAQKAGTQAENFTNITEEKTTSYINKLDTEVQ
ncbi:class III signal peptide-containing protein [Methanocaldococcus fervens]|uniref:Class III signal peptide-containing protein n=1 Tax=Methanocaldococcus fervens (strain DSM 4213 / JCM 15782 / AG86) TaxID=573064 RepID=C7P968_METFA|nr:class III signal peptide-containing protein [Methanocaldococcus fervens]ACV25100.1 Protein of unknown function DUF361 [Methanocaldococcus fervens AG86]